MGCTTTVVDGSDETDESCLRRISSCEVDLLESSALASDDVEEDEDDEVVPVDNL